MPLTELTLDSAVCELLALLHSFKLVNKTPLALA